MTSVTESNARQAAKREMKNGGGDVVDSTSATTSQTRAPEQQTQDDATPAATQVADIPSVYLMMPRHSEQATTHLRDAREIRRSLMAWSRQAIAVCIIILMAGVVLMMLAITLIAKDKCKAVKEA